MKIVPRRWATGAAIFVLLAAAYLAVRDPGVPVETAEVRPDTLTVTLAVEGRTRPAEPFSVTAPVAGRLERIAVREGAAIRQGETVARIVPAREDPRTLALLRADLETARANRLEAESALAQAEARADQARRDSDRRTALAEAGSLSSEVIEQAQTAARVADRALAASEAHLSAADARLRAAEARLVGATDGTSTVPAFEVVAPIDGRVLRVPDLSERVVAAGTPLLDLADMQGLEVVFDVLSEDAVRIEPGQTVTISEWGGETPLAARVRTVTLAGYTKVSALGVEEQRVDVIADLQDTPTTLGAGYRVAGDVVVWHGQAPLVVPAGAVFRSGTGWAVFAAQDDRAVLRPVEIGRRNVDRVEVLAGLEVGTNVVLFPAAAVEDGGRIRVHAPGP